jgi:hypothetical protein
VYFVSFVVPCILSESPHNPLVFELGIMAKVHEQAELASGDLEVVVNLSAVLVGQGGDGFQLHDDLCNGGTATRTLRPVVLPSPLYSGERCWG